MQLRLTVVEIFSCAATGSDVNAFEQCIAKMANNTDGKKE